MPDRAALERLAARYGIAAGYDDIAGRHIVVPDASLIALLAAFDVTAANDEQIVEALGRADAASAAEALPPVCAITAGKAGWSVPLRLPEAVQELRWTLTEGGCEEAFGSADRPPRDEGTKDADEAHGTDAANAVHHGVAEATALAELAPGDATALRGLEFQLALPPGYHRLDIDGLAGSTCVIAAPATCFQPAALAGRVWGVAVQLYGLRSARNWGIGDFADLEQLIVPWAERGADLIGLNPLHALFAHNPAHASPYSPSSRRQLNVLYIAVDAVDDYAECAAARRHAESPNFRERLAALRASELVDHVGVAAAKFEVLEQLYAHFRAEHLTQGSARAQAFRAFQAAGGIALRQHALFEALQAHWHARDPSIWGWPVWPAEYRAPEAPAVQAFAAENLERIEWHEYLQWQARQQLDRAAGRCRELGMAIGLYLDLAVSVDRAGSDVWTERSCYADAASIGAPPDEFNQQGQGWGLPPLRPDRLRAARYRPFVKTLRANMQSARALRIDHVMGLMRLFWIPPGGTPASGGYVHYALGEMLAIVALESERSGCLVIGEDLGVVADEMRQAMARERILSCRLLYFEREADGAFKPPTRYPRDALVAVGSHDAAPLAGWWNGDDLRLRHALGLTSADDETHQLAGRAEDRRLLLQALAEAGLMALPNAAGRNAQTRDAAVPEPLAAPTALTPALIQAIHAWLATAPSRVMLLQLEDALGLAAQTNMPGTTIEHPNWRRKLPATLDEMAASGRIAALAATLAACRPRPSLEARVPRATYRLQLHKGFDFEAAARIVPYLARLGVSHVYCSPILRARPGSLHGYDVVAHDEINPELGGLAGFDRFSRVLRAHGIGQLLDIVPNHMGVLGADNAWWMEVLENGECAAHAHHFDIDWHPIDAELDGKVLLPLLGAHYGEELANGQLRIAFEAGGTFALRYHEHRCPLAPRSYAAPLRRAAALAGNDEARAALEALALDFEQLPPCKPEDAAAVKAGRARQGAAKAQLAQLAAGLPAAAHAIDAALAALNAAHDALHELIEAQAWRPAYWRVAADEINYRRFFDINELAALRMEDPEVFEATHGFILDLAAAGHVDGLRIDHSDGLHDPAEYFERLQAGYARRVGLVLPPPDARQRPARPLYVVAEKIAAPHEDVPTSWAVHGTTGYRYASVVNGVLVDRAARARIDRVWRSFSGVTEDYAELAYRGKRAIMRSTLASELTLLATELLRIARADRRSRDYTFNALRSAIAEAAACLPVYRTYIVRQPSVQDRRYIDWAIAQARRRSHAADVSIFDFVHAALLGQALPDAAPALVERVRRFAMRFQQFSAPVAAKGVEDTAFYRFSRLVSLNEVGGDPDLFGVTVRAFHGASSARAAHWPDTLLATSTHDNKRGEDVRCRIDVLSERPAAWRLALRRWRVLNRSHRRPLEGRSAPSAADEYLLYQTLLGSLPTGELDEAQLAAWRARIEAYMLKAAREAKVETSWISPNAEYEAALAGFIAGALGRLDPNPFLDELREFGRSTAWFGALNSLSMVLLKFSSPGVPDLYQGDELIDLSLVDPDNRRPVDFAARAQWLDEFETLRGQADLPQRLTTLAAAPHDGRAKLWLTWRLLALHAEQPRLFRLGAYTPLAAAGAGAAHLVAYARRLEGDSLVFIAGRLYAQLLVEPERLPLGEDVWGDTTVEVPFADASVLENVISGERLRVADGRVRVADAWASFPGAALRLAPATDGPGTALAAAGD